MPIMRAGDVQREIDCVVLDKDGTLIDHHSAWFARYDNSVIAVAEAAGGGDPLRKALYHAMAIDTANQRFVTDAPNKSLKIADHALMVTTILHQNGCDWEAAENIVAEYMLPKLTTPLGSEAIRGIGDIRERLQVWKSGGVQLAVLTNDNRVSTLADMRTLGIDQMLSVVVSADDGLAAKPAPDGVAYIAQSLDISPSCIALIGDTTADLMAARAAGAACDRCAQRPRQRSKAGRVSRCCSARPPRPAADGAIEVRSYFFQRSSAASSLSRASTQWPAPLASVSFFQKGARVLR